MSDEQVVSTPAPEASLEAQPQSEQSSENTESQDLDSQELAAEESEGSEQPRSDAEIEADKSLTKKEKAAEKRLNKLKIKFNGKEMDEDLPFDIPDTPEATEYMRKHIQMSKLSQHKAQEYASLEKQAIEFIQALKENPEAVLADPRVGIDVKKLATQIIEKEIANARKSPEQLELERTQAELKALREARELEAKQLKEREFQANVEKYYEQLETQMTQGLEQHKLPRNDIVVGMIVNYLEEATANNLKVSVSDVIPLVKEEMKNNFKALASSMSPEDLEDWVGKEVLSNYRKSNLKKVKENQKVAALKSQVKDTGKTGKVEEKKAEPISYKDFFKI